MDVCTLFFLSHGLCQFKSLSQTETTFLLSRTKLAQIFHDFPYIFPVVLFRKEALLSVTKAHVLF